MIVEKFDLNKHYPCIELPRQYELSVCNPEDIGVRFLELSSRGPTYTAIEDGKIIGVGGITIYWPGVGEAWLFLTEYVSKYWPRTHRMAIKYLDKLITEYDLKRISAAIRCDFRAGRKWAEKLGFEFEGIMRKYGPEGADYALYALIMGEE